MPRRSPLRDGEFATAKKLGGNRQQRQAALPVTLSNHDPHSGSPILDNKASHAAGGPTRMKNAKIAVIQFQILPPKNDIEQSMVRIQKEIEEADVGYNEPLEDEEVEEAYEYDDEDDISLRTDVETARGRDRRGKGIMYEGGRSSITGRKRRGTTDIRVRRGMQPPSGRVPTGSIEDRHINVTILQFLLESTQFISNRQCEGARRLQEHPIQRRFTTSFLMAFSVIQTPQPRTSSTSWGSLSSSDLPRKYRPPSKALIFLDSSFTPSPTDLHSVVPLKSTNSPSSSPISDSSLLFRRKLLYLESLQVNSSAAIAKNPNLRSLISSSKRLASHGLISGKP
ncbi:T-complex protein 1 subunit delta [Nymphaea thermarum]|nr:T-complex protein 1 subunit delta [Nymphaea thermarum]